MIIFPGKIIYIYSIYYNIILNNYIQYIFFQCFPLFFFNLTRIISNDDYISRKNNILYMQYILYNIILNNYIYSIYFSMLSTVILVISLQVVSRKKKMNRIPKLLNLNLETITTIAIISQSERQRKWDCFSRTSFTSIWSKEFDKWNKSKKTNLINPFLLAISSLYNCSLEHVMLY